MKTEETVRMRKGGLIMENILVLCDDLWHPAEVIEKGLVARKDARFCFDIVKAAKDIITPARIAKYRLIICCKGNSVIAANTAPTPSIIWTVTEAAEICLRKPSIPL